MTHEPLVSRELFGRVEGRARENENQSKAGVHRTHRRNAFVRSTPPGQSRSLKEDAAGEAAWQRSPERARLAAATSRPASWRLPPRAPKCLGAEDPSIGRRAWGWHRERTVTSATVAARVRKAGKVALDDAEFTRMDARLQAAREHGGDLRAIGDWHTHPVGDSRPSDADLRCQARELATIGDHNVSLTSLIVTRREGSASWRNPHISAWITRHARSWFGEQFVVEPAIVHVR